MNSGKSQKAGNVAKVNPNDIKNMNFTTTSNLRIVTMLLGVPAISGCQHINVAQITYEMLRAEDCRRNQLEDFCARTYASEYYDYERMRQEFMRNQTQEVHTEKQTDVTNQLTLHKVLDIH